MYQLDDLSYSYDALEPYISKMTIDVHYNLHAQGYLNKLNTLLQEIGYDFSNSMIYLVTHISEIPFDKRDDILYQAMGVLNHNLYFKSMHPRHTLPKGKLKEQIEKKYGSYDAFQKEFIRVSNTLVGSGYTFLVAGEKGVLTIMNTSNQDSPYVYGYTPLLALDLWEHSYYLDYLNKRVDYIDNFFQIVDFKYANEEYEKIYQEL